MRTRSDGYERVRAWDPLERRERYAYVHQLVAIANGADPSEVFSGGRFHIHHRNGCKFDNRPGNLEVRRSDEHGRHHHDQRVATDGGYR